MGWFKIYILEIKLRENPACRTLVEKSSTLLVLAQELALSRVAKTATDLARELAPKRSGRLAHSIGLKQATIGRRVVATGSDISYAAIQEYGGVIQGTGEKIYPKRAKVLRFIKTKGPEAGAVKFRKWVRSHDIHIPGRQYMLRTVSFLEPTLSFLTEATVREVLQRAGIQVS